MEHEIPKVYSPEMIEPRWAREWVKRKLYTPADDDARPHFALVIPPPNITGSLHMGHMLEHTEIDILMRWHRMRGENVLWLPGSDHASIATQVIVERELGRETSPDVPPGPEAESTWRREGQRLRRELGREKFVSRCWQWKEASGGAIRKQMERLGTSCDWSRDRFTMDPAYTCAVIEVFVRLYEDGLIYRGKYIVIGAHAAARPCQTLKLSTRSGKESYGTSGTRSKTDRVASPSPRRAPRPCWAIRPWP